MKFSKILLLIFVFSSSVFGAPQTSLNGGTNVSNPNSAHLYFDQDVHLPDDINLQNAYSNSALKRIVFPFGQGIAFLDSALENQFIISDNGTIGFNSFVVSKDGSSGVSIYGTEDPTSTIFQVKSSVFGSNPFPYMTKVQKNSINIANAKPGWGVFDTDDRIIDIYDGVEEQQLLSAQHVTGSGAVTVTNDGHGSINIFGSGSTAPDAAYSSFSTQNNSSATVFPGINTFKPVYLGTLFSGDNSTDFSNSFLTIDSVSTPVMTYTGATTQAFDVHESFSIRGAIATMSSFKFCIAVRLSNGTVQITNYCQLVTTDNLIDFIPGPKLEGNITLSTGDSVFAEAQNITNTNSIYAAFSNFLTSSVSGSIPDTNGLPQGTNNKYLSTDGGATLESATGTINSGHLAQFSGTSGLVSDSGIPAANIILSTGSYANPSWITSLNATKLTNLIGSINQVDVNNNGTNIIVSLPQNINTAASPTFAGVILTGSANPLNLDNDGNIRAKNSGGTYETSIIPRDSSNREVFEMGSGGLIARQNGAGTTALSIDNTGVVSIPGLTSGSIPFIGASGAISQRNTKLAWDDANSQLVIGTASAGAAGSGSIRMNQNDIYLNSGSTDVYNGLGVYLNVKPFGGIDPAGPVLYGSSGGMLGTVAFPSGTQTGILRWQSNGNITALTGDIIINTAGKTTVYKTGTNACAGSGAVMVAGVVTVSTTCAVTGSIITAMKTTNGGTTTTGVPVVSIVNGTSFTLTGDTTDTSTWSWIINKTN